MYIYIYIYIYIDDVAKTIASALAGSRLDYANAVLV